MSKFRLPKGVVLNSEQKGLLSITDEHLACFVKNDALTDVYIVEQTPFARGTFAAVRKCTHRETGAEFAAKYIRKRRRAKDQRPDIYHEVAVLALADGANRIVKLHEVYETSSEIVLILELAAGGELQYVLDVQEGLEELQAARLMRQILQALSFLHSHGIAHLDLKPQNILLTENNPECDIKLCDFGISRVVQEGVEIREILGTPDYVAPEILGYEPISLATDVWSVGVLAYVLLSGFSPFRGNSKQETFLNISKCKLDFPEELFQDVSKCAQEFIQTALCLDPKNRPSIEDCLEHPWFVKMANGICSVVISPEEISNEFSKEEDTKINISSECDSCKIDSIEQKIDLLSGQNNRNCSDFDRMNIIRSLKQNCKDQSPITGEGDFIRNCDDNVLYVSVKNTGNNIDGDCAILTGQFENDTNSHYLLKSTSTHDSSSLSHADNADEEDSPVNKRAKNCLAIRRSSFPVASCLSSAQCGSPHSAPHSPDLHFNHHRHSNMTSSPVEIVYMKCCI